MEKMLAYIKQISKVETEGVLPLTQLYTNSENVCNNDEKLDWQFKTKLLENAPESDKDYVIVPKTV
ncbi:MAG: hypothetical protein J6L69_11010 [Lachnospiraceae bacterium]|nr:hypothetical protein [Lachnospiraceae bacterium]